MNTGLTGILFEGVEFLVPGTGPVPPMDPIDVEALPPADIDCCEHCDGLGARVVYIEAETGLPVDEPCSWCDGTGNRYGRAVA